MAAGHHHAIVIDDALTVVLVEEKTVGGHRGMRMASGERVHLPYQVICLGYGFCLLRAGLVDGERTESQCLMLPEGIEGTRSAVLAAATLWDEEPVLYLSPVLRSLGHGIL